MTSIFLSHNSEDKEFVKDLSKLLEKEGIKTWVDEAEIEVGDSLIDKISSGITEMEYLGVILSPKSVNSEWVKKEVEIALTKEINNKKVKVLPILYEKCEIPPFLSTKMYLNFTDSKNFLKELEKLTKKLKGEKREKSIKTIKTVKEKIPNVSNLIKEDKFERKKLIFEFAKSSQGLFKTRRDALKLAGEWTEKYSNKEINKIIHLFKFAKSSEGLFRTRMDALDYALKTSKKYSNAEINNLIKYFKFAKSNRGLFMTRRDALNYALEELEKNN